jgi:hypothetical protein
MARTDLIFETDLARASTELLTLQMIITFKIPHFRKFLQ